MPSEFRRVTFTNNELIEAIHDHNQVSRDKLPAGMIVSCKPVSEPDVAVRLDLVDQASGETRLAYLSPEVVAAVLLRYCMKRRIPMPRKAAKPIEIHGDEISLKIEIEGRLGPSEDKG